MSRTAYRYLVAKLARPGRFRHYWQPTAQLMMHGWATVRLDDDPDIARFQAKRINDRLDAWRAKGEPVLATPPSLPTAVKDHAEPRPGHRPRFVHPLAIVPGRDDWWVYVFVQREGLTKVGISRDPARRLRQLRRASTIDLRLYGACGPFGRVSAMAVEAISLKLLAPLSAGGEWLRAEGAYVEAVVLKAVRDRRQVGFTA